MLAPELQDLLPQYAAALAMYLNNRGEGVPWSTGELGELACRCGVLAHQLVSIHAEALASLTSIETAAEVPAHFEFLAQAIAALEERDKGANSTGSACPQCSDSGCSDSCGTILEDTRKRRQFLNRLSTRILRSSEPKESIGEVIRDLVPEVAECVALHWIGAGGQINLAKTHTQGQGQGVPQCGCDFCRELVGMAVSRGVVVSVDEPGNERVRHATVVPFIANGEVIGTVAMCQMSTSRELSFVHEFGEQMACCTQHAFESARYRAAAQSSHRFLDDYLNRAIHDLSSPLGTLSLVLEIGLNRIEQGRLPNESSLRRAMAQVEQMTTVLRELFDTTRTELTKSDRPSAPEITATQET